MNEQCKTFKLTEDSLYQVVTVEKNINKVQRKGLCKNAAQNGKKEAKYKVLQDGLSSQVSGVFQRI